MKMSELLILEDDCPSSPNTLEVDLAFGSATYEVVQARIENDYMEISVELSLYQAKALRDHLNNLIREME